MLDSRTDEPRLGRRGDPDRGASLCHDRDMTEAPFFVKAQGWDKDHRETWICQKPEVVSHGMFSITGSAPDVLGSIETGPSMTGPWTPADITKFVFIEEVDAPQQPQRCYYCQELRPPGQSQGVCENCGANRWV